MAGRYDVTMKHLLGLRLADWKPLFGVSAEVTVQPVDADLSHVAALADKVLRVEEDPPWILHPEPQAWRDDELDVRMLHYHSTLLKQMKLPTHSVAVVLHPSAWSPENRGSIDLASPRPGCAVRFEYQVIKVWELPVEMFLEGGVGLLPLAPLSDVSRTEMPAVIDRLAERLMTEVPRAEAAELGTATLLLMGLRYSDDEARHLLRSLRPIMQGSSTYHALIQEGFEKGIEQGLEQGVERGKHDLILAQGTRRFGKPGVRVRRRIEAIHDPAVLDSLALRLLEVDSWKELLAEMPAS